VDYLTLQAIEAAIRESWSIETCDPTDIPQWSPANPARGQCPVTSLVLHDLVGGQLLEAEVHHTDGSSRGFHYWNRLPGVDVDLTREQFDADEIVQEPNLINRDPAFPWLAHNEYLIFRRRVYAALKLPVPDNAEEPNR
jgi:hypothetical protein